MLVFGNSFIYKRKTQRWGTQNWNFNLQLQKSMIFSSFTHMETKLNRPTWQSTYNTAPLAEKQEVRKLRTGTWWKSSNLARRSLKRSNLIQECAPSVNRMLPIDASYTYNCVRTFPLFLKKGQMQPTVREQELATSRSREWLNVPSRKDPSPWQSHCLASLFEV